MFHYSEIAHVKLNLFLSVGDRNIDTDMHCLESAYFPLLIGDILTVDIVEMSSVNNGSKSILEIQVELDADLTRHLIQQNRSTDDFTAFLKSDENLISKTTKTFFNSELFLNKYKETNIHHIRVRLHKVIPDKAGLGGGSSDAAAMLRILAKHFSIDESSLYKMASMLGADVLPCFVNRPSFFLADNENLTILNSSNKLKSKVVLLLKPPCGSDTKLAFSRLNRPLCQDIRKVDSRSVRALSSIISAYELDNQHSDSCPHYFFNDFEDSVFSEIPGLHLAKSILQENGAEIASLTGSGSTIFGIFNTSRESKLAISELEKKFDNTWWIAETAFS